MPLSAFIRDSQDAKDESALFAALRLFVKRFDADIVVYNMLVENLHHLKAQDSTIFYDAPPQWIATYAANKYFRIDPILRAGMKAHEAFHWYECGKIIALTSDQQRYLKDMRSCGLVDGIALPVRPGLGSAALFCIGSTKHAFELSPEAKCELWCACINAHNRCMELRGKYPEPELGLSPREREVLTLVAKGKSNTAIAKNLGVSDHTIDTLVRRCFIKLGVSDRISASLKAVGTGAVEI